MKELRPKVMHRDTFISSIKQKSKIAIEKWTICYNKQLQCTNSKFVDCTNIFYIYFLENHSVESLTYLSKLSGERYSRSKEIQNLTKLTLNLSRTELKDYKVRKAINNKNCR